SDAAISALTNSGFGINNIGTVNFSNTVSVDGVIAGNGIITNTGNLALLSDDSAFTGIFNQTAGETTVGVSARMLGGTNNISNSTLNVTSIAGIYYNATLGTNGILNNYSALIAAQNIDTSKISFAAGATGATMNFGRDATLAAANNLANYNLTGYIANSAGNTVSFSDSNISFDPTNMAGVTTYDFTDGTNYVFNDSVIDLTNTGTNVRTFNVGNMATYNSTLSFSLMLTGSGNPYTEFISDKLNVTNYTGDTLALGTIKILNPSAEDGLTGPFYIQDILSGAQFTAGQTASFATTVYQYLATVDAPQTGLELDIVGESDENSLYIMNDNYHSAGVRGFNFSLTNETYNIGKSLSATNAGTFVVQGYNDDATNSILSGEILAGYYGGQNLKGSFFNLSGLNGDVAFTLQNLTIQDAYTFAGDDITFGDSSDPAYDSGPNGNDGYGSVLKITDANSTALIQNVIAQRNTAQFEGGAIYAMDGLTVLSMTQFLHNTAQTGSGGAIYNEADVRIRNGAIFDGNNALAGLGGAIYNSGTLLLDSTFGDIVFENNSDSTGANDIYGDDDSIININGTAGTVAIYSGITGLGEINKTGTGTFDIYADSSAYTGTFTQTDGITNVYTSGFFMGDTNLSGGIINFAESASAGAMNVSNGGIVNLRGTDFNTLTVTDWSGGNGYLWLNTYFDGNGTSTDKLVVAGGDATGTTTLFINSVGTNNVVTPDGEYGIMVVDLTNAFDKSAIFTLNGGMIDTGAYEYHLVKELDDNWYLETDWTPTSVAQTAGAIPIIHLAVVKAGMNELRKRLGELRGDDKSRHNGVWVRTYGKSKNIHKYIDADLDLLGIEGGYDHQFNVDSGRIYVGVMAGMLESRDIRIHQSNGHTGRGTTSAPSVGAYATWVHKSGSPNKWFIDATVRHFWVDTDLKNIASNGQTVSYDIDRNFIASSLETGKLFYFRAPEFANIGTKQNSHMSMEPKAEVRFKYAPSKNATTNFGDDIHIDSTTGLNTKLALQTNYLPNGTQSVWKPWIEIGVFREWLGNENVGFGGAQIHTSARGNGMELAAGTNVSLGERSYGFAGFTYETGEVYTSYQLNIGARMKF
ncbi:MAG: autotransporter outer membrane beta-barrel domain-containing protein, partial [Alphaproteobacteria bacterium]|nr:autotransporter outer membrane beta-barrel domain-containing protein [Alphaproteobacteria bacterium]